MPIRQMRLIMGLFFLCAGTALLVVRFGFPEALPRMDPLRLFLGALLALALGCWNLAKWYTGWLWYQEQATPVRYPLQPDPNAEHRPEVLPEFDFDKPSNDKPNAY